MPYITQNAVTVSPIYTEQAKGRWTRGARKIDVWVAGDNVFLQTAEDDSFIDDVSQEVFLPSLGGALPTFHSRVFVTPFRVWRFRSQSAPAAVNVTVYG